MSELIATDRQLLQQDAIVELFEIDVTKYGSGILRFSPSSVAGVDIVFNGQTYVSAPVEAEGFEVASGGTLPRPTMRVAVGDTAFLSILIGSDDLIGCPVTRTRTYRKYLDDGDMPNPTATFPIDYYLVNKKAEQTRHTLTLELTPRMDQEGRMVPALQVLRDTCTHRFRQWTGAAWDYSGVTCPYTGPTLFDISGSVTTDEYQAQCGRKVDDCSRHFGSNAVLPFRGFPGVGRI